MEDAIAQNENEKNHVLYKVTTAKDLILKVQNEPEPVIVWNGIVEGSKGLIAGVSKTGKTTLAENLAISLATGKSSFFGFPLIGIPEKVLFINFEESFRIRSRRNLKQISELTEKEKDLFYENYYSTPEDFPEFLVTEENWIQLNKYINDVNPNYVFIDSLSHMFEGQIEASEASIRFIKKFRKYVSSLNKTVIIVHHNTKGNEKPIDQDSVAGSRVILQEFEYALGLANIPTHTGGNYLCMLNNKYIEKDDTTAYTYKINSNNWVERISTINKFELYSESKKDYRTSTSNKDLIYDFIASQTSQTNQSIKTRTLYEYFLNDDCKIMSRDTLHQSLNKLKEESKIESKAIGEYNVKDESGNESGNNLQGS